MGRERLTLRRRSVGGLAAAGFVLAAGTVGTPAPRDPLVDLRAPGVFDPARRATRVAVVDYQVNATVLVPLLFASLPIVDRDDVGVASFSARDFDAGADGTLRAFEFFAMSDPARARGLNRLGFFREAVAIDGTGVRWTAQFGVMTIDRADSRQSAEGQFDDAQEDVAAPQPMSVNDSWIGADRATSTVTRFALGGVWTRPVDLYRDVLPRWRTAPVDDDDRRMLPSRASDDIRYDTPVGFFGKIQESLRQVAGDLRVGRRVRRRRDPYVHNSEVLYLELRGHDVDERRTGAYRERRIVAGDAVVHKLDYRVLDAEGDETDSFTIWTELPIDPVAIAPDGPAIMPVAFDYKPRAFLELNAVRVGRLPPDR